jgi:transposase
VPILADTVDGVIGVDTHRDTLAAAAVTPIGRIIAQTHTTADPGGYPTLLDFAQTQIPGQRCWAVERTGSYGAGLACFLLAHGERVVEVGRPKRPVSRTGAKSDAVDALRAAREALAFDHTPTPRRRGDREALRVLLTTRHGAVRARVEAINQPQGAGRRRSRTATRGAAGPFHQRPGRRLCQATRPASQVAGASRNRPRAAGHSPTHPAAAEADELQAELAALVGAIAPWLLGAARGWADQRCTGAGELVVCRSAALARRRLRPWRG